MDFVKNYYSEIQFNTPQENTAPEELPLPILETLLDTKDIFNVLELGCGNGWLSNRIAQNYPSLTVTGIDIVSENVCKSTSKIKIENWFHLCYRCQSRTRIHWFCKSK